VQSVPHVDEEQGRWELVWVTVWRAGRLTVAERRKHDSGPLTVACPGAACVVEPRKEKRVVVGPTFFLRAKKVFVHEV
jgi:hypothetical protein